MKFCAPIFPMGTKGGIKEGLAKIQMPAGVFFNPHMQLCRDIFSLSIGALPEKKLSLCDCFAASGARGIRYKLENKNISKLSLSFRRVCRVFIGLFFQPSVKKYN